MENRYQQEQTSTNPLPDEGSGDENDLNEVGDTLAQKPNDEEDSFVDVEAETPDSEKTTISMSENMPQDDALVDKSEEKSDSQLEKTQKEVFENKSKEQIAPNNQMPNLMIIE